MPAFPRTRKRWESVLSIGAHSGESEIQRGARRIFVGYLFFSAVVRLWFGFITFSEGDSVTGLVLFAVSLTSIAALVLLRVRPSWFVGVVSATLIVLLLHPLVETVAQGGLVPSGMVILHGTVAVVGALITLSVRAAFWWFLAYLFTVALAVVLPNFIEPSHLDTGEDVVTAINVIVATAFVYAGMAYFVRQRNRFQAQSDDLLHNILPREIAAQLKAGSTLIADDYESASVLFADMVGFTPMSAAMTPPELIDLLNDVFATFDGFVEELGLEKIRTVGDEYMVAAGVPLARPDHAHAIAELALRIRDHTEQAVFDGHKITFRIGINSGPLVAGVVGTHKFSYDVWGDVVNVASRMESGGVPGSIQITAATYELIRNDFVCEPRGVVSVKGKGDMSTFILLDRKSGIASPR
ncbi:MAG: adenylate/guanylate cyclase domain-containing protein [Acidimicrobiia bacterium]|nr:adenylate/guanylate cyclase domain-containing protein [Acidimicrobiia bacterium]